MIAVVAAFAGAAVTGIGLLVASKSLHRPPHLRTNFRGTDVIGTAGLVLAASLVAVWLVSLLSDDGSTVALAMAGAGLLFGVLGLFDDLYGDRRAGGLVGHARALVRGRATTGMLKAGGGAVVGLLAAWGVGWRDVWVIAAGAVVALSSNLANLFDLRPGRAIKVWVLPAVWLGVLLSLDAPRIVLAGLGGALVVFLVAELRERVMLGDTGAGLLGAVAGVGAVSVLDRSGVLVAAVLLLALTLASELVSFTRVIEAVAPLRWLDRLGRRT